MGKSTLPLTTGSQKRDPMTISLSKDEQQFKRLRFWDQLDCLQAHAATPEPIVLVVWISGLLLCGLHLAILYWITKSYSSLETATTHSLKISEEEDSNINLHVLAKNFIAYSSLICYLGLEGTYANAVSGFTQAWRVWQVGTMKEPLFGFLGTKRNIVDGPLLSLAFCVSRVWLLISPQPSPECAHFYLFMTVAWLVLGYGQFGAPLGFYALPFAIFLWAETIFGRVAGSITLLQLFLIVLYIGCGVGKFGPWFAQVFTQEWTLPPWATLVDLRSLFLKHPGRETTLTSFARCTAFAAAFAEFLGGFLMLFPVSLVKNLMSGVQDTFGFELPNRITSFSSVEEFLQVNLAPFDLVSNDTVAGISDFFGGDNCSVLVALAVTIVVAMHLYIILHMPVADVNILNLVPAYLSYYVFIYLPKVVTAQRQAAEALGVSRGGVTGERPMTVDTLYTMGVSEESGFNHDAFWLALPTGFRILCAFFLAFVVYGHIKTDHIPYWFAYRFWAGNWPQGWFVVSPKGIEKIKAKYPQWRHSPPLHTVGLATAWEREFFNWMLFGAFQTGQLCHRVMPKLLWKALGGKLDVVNNKNTDGAGGGGGVVEEKEPQSLSDHSALGGRIYMSMFFNMWFQGICGNDSHRSWHVLRCLQEECNFDTGELVFLHVHSFGTYQLMDSSETTYHMIDAKDGVVDEGKISLGECLRTTKPSVWRERLLRKLK